MSAAITDRFDAIREGERIPELRVTMDRETYFSYNKLFHEINPLHFDLAYAQRLGFPDIVVAGVYTFSFIPRMLEAWAGPAGRIGTMDIRYQRPILIEAVVVHGAWVRKKIVEAGRRRVECEVKVTDEAGEVYTTAIVTMNFT